MMSKLSHAVKAVKQAFAVRWFLKFRFRGGRRDWAIEAVNFGLIGLAGGAPIRRWHILDPEVEARQGGRGMKSHVNYGQRGWAGELPGRWPTFVPFCEYLAQL